VEEFFASNTGCGLVLRQTSGGALFQPLSHIIHHARDTLQGVFDVGEGCCLIFVYAGTSGTDAIAYAGRISHCFGRLWKKIEKADSAGGLRILRIPWMSAIAPCWRRLLFAMEMVSDDETM
jgi:hypothetical protein